MDPKILQSLIETGNVWLILVVLFVIVVLPTILNFITEQRRSNKFNQILDKQDQMINEQKEVNKHMLTFLDKKMTHDELNTIQITDIFENYLNAAKFKIIDEVRLTLQMNNLKEKESTKEKVNSYCKEIITDTFEKMFWFEYKGIKTGSILNNVWIKSVCNRVLDFIYNNKFALREDIPDKSTYYDYNVLNRNMELLFKEFINAFNKRLQLLQSDIERKIDTYNKEENE
jgi:hypothetical protein